MTENMLKDVLRYIGMPAHEKDEELIEKIIDIYKALESVAVPKFTYRKLPICRDEKEVQFIGSLLSVKSKDLVKLFRHVKEGYVMAVTLGKEVDRFISMKQRVHMLEAMIWDACASVMIEKVCDELESDLQKTLEEGQYFTMRFSPGYGDVPLSCQEQVLDLLEASKRTGISLTKAQMLFPTKSITAFLGISNQKENRQKTCGTCYLVKTCAYRKRGDQCGN